MKLPGKILHSGLIILLAVLTVGAAEVYPQVDITGRRADIDLSDIITPQKKQYSETETRKLCADITERYHSLGYTAFQIRSAVLKKDGRVELFFSDPVVENVFVTGAGHDDELAASAIYIKGRVFNEFTLNDNIRNVKKIYSVKRVTVDLKRNSNDGIDIFVTAEKRIWGGSISAASDPVYGALSSVSAAINFNSSALSVAMESTAGVRDASYTKAAMNYLYNMQESQVSFFFGAEYGDCRDYLYDDDGYLFKLRYAGSRAGISSGDGAVKYFFAIVSSFAEYEDYPGIGEGLTFTGSSAEIRYNDKEYRIDPLDEVTAWLKCDYGWNHIEEDMALRLRLKGNTALPVTRNFSVTAFIDSNYTSERLRIFHAYVFDRTLPVRNRDYRSTPWRSVARLGLLSNLYGRIIYLSPEYVAALYKRCGGVEPVHAAGARLLFKSDSISSEIAYTVEIKEKLKDGAMTFAAGACF